MKQFNRVLFYTHFGILYDQLRGIYAVGYGFKLSTANRIFKLDHIYNE